MEDVNIRINNEEENAWYEAGLSADGCELGEWEREAIVRYGRFLTGNLLDAIHNLRMENSGQAAQIEQLKDKIKKWDEKYDSKQLPAPGRG